MARKKEGPTFYGHPIAKCPKHRAYLQDTGRISEEGANIFCCPKGDWAQMFLLAGNYIPPEKRVNET